MSEDTPAPEAEPTPTTPAAEAAATSGTDTTTTEPAPRRRSMPRWLPLFLLAVVPAVIVGIAVGLLRGGGSSGSNENDAQAAAIIDGFIHSSPSSDSTVMSYKNQLAPGFPKDFPVYKGAKVVASFSIVGSDGTNYFAVLSSNDTPDTVYGYYLTAMDKDPYQVQIATTGEEFTGVRFTQASDPDVEGEVAVHRSDLDKRTNIYVTFQTPTSSSDAKAQSPKYTPGASRSLPSGYPGSDVPVYKGKSPSIVTDTYMERSPGGIQYIVSFITKDSQDDVLSYYRKQFGDKGWTVSDSSDKNQGFAIAIDFDDGAKKTSGTIATDDFDKDNSYTKVDLYVTANKGAGGGPTTPKPSTASTPSAPSAVPNTPTP